MASTAPGQVEINFAPASGVAAADQAFVFKNAVKEMAQQAGFMASFMTKPCADQSASGCHYHHSLYRPEDVLQVHLLAARPLDAKRGRAILVTPSRVHAREADS